MMLLAGALLALPATARAAYDFECDTPPNRASIVDQKVAGPAASVSGTVSFVLARGGRYPPSGSVKVESGDESVSVTLQMIGTEPATYNAAAAPDPRYTVVLLSKGPGGPARTDLGKLAPASTNLPFSVSVGADGAATASVGPLSGKAKLAPLTAPRARLLCSSGQFAFHGVEAR